MFQTFFLELSYFLTFQIFLIFPHFYKGTKKLVPEKQSFLHIKCIISHHVQLFLPWKKLGKGQKIRFFCENYSNCNLQFCFTNTALPNCMKLITSIVIITLRLLSLSVAILKLFVFVSTCFPPEWTSQGTNSRGEIKY